MITEVIKIHEETMLELFQKSVKKFQTDIEYSGDKNFDFISNSYLDIKEDDSN